MHRFIFPLSLFLSASLLFVIQPMVGKVLLPVYGGTPAVWTICMLFFQAVLLIAYGYVWFLSRIKHWRMMHLCLCLLSLLALPLMFSPVSGEGSPEFFILKNLLLQLGLPLLVVGSSAPLLQYAFSQTDEKHAVDPYYLYAASNIGSLLALLSYPWFIERFAGVSQQFHIWNGVYGLYLALLLWVLYMDRNQQRVTTLENPGQIAWNRRFKWIFLSFIPCSLMMGVTFYISTDIAATPLFWVLPLALYLLSFVITFARKPVIPHCWVVKSALLFLALPVIVFIVGTNHIPAWQTIAALLGSFFVLALLCHGELVQMRPDVSHLTTFYLCLALGGLLAGLFNGLIAPRVFAHAYDYPVVILLSILCIPLKIKRKNRREWLLPWVTLILLLLNYYLFPDALKTYHVVELLVLLLIVIPAVKVHSRFLSMIILFAFIFMPWFKPAHILSQQRNFYGVKQVFSQAGAHVLMSQSTMHGFQMVQDENPTNGARAYYASVLPVVQLMEAAHHPLHAMVLGLGTGIMACQFREEDKLSVVEIDEQVINIARDPGLFTYLRDCPPQITLLQDDGLLAVTRIPNASLELLVMDAFTSDAIPVHLLTLEAISLYQRKIATDGVILVNISNRHLRALPVLTAAARKLDLILLHKQQMGNSKEGSLAAEWAVLTTNEALAGQLLAQQGWRFVAESDALLWTNDYSNIVPLLRWG